MTITINDKKYLKEGGPNSGNFGHAGRPGQQGGSGPGGGGPNVGSGPSYHGSAQSSKYDIAKSRIKGLKGKGKGYALSQKDTVNIKTGRGMWFKMDQYKRVVMGLGKRMNPKAKGPEKRTDYRAQLGMGGAKGVYDKLYGKGK